MGGRCVMYSDQWSPYRRLRSWSVTVLSVVPWRPPARSTPPLPCLRQAHRGLPPPHAGYSQSESTAAIKRKRKIQGNDTFYLACPDLCIILNNETRTFEKRWNESFAKVDSSNRNMLRNKLGGCFKLVVQHNRNNWLSNLEITETYSL